jgi:hypothetical protein
VWPKETALWLTLIYLLRLNKEKRFELPGERGKLREIKRKRMGHKDGRVAPSPLMRIIKFLPFSARIGRSLYKCKFPLWKENLYSVFRALPAGSQWLLPKLVHLHKDILGRGSSDYSGILPSDTFISVGHSRGISARFPYWPHGRWGGHWSGHCDSAEPSQIISQSHPCSLPMAWLMRCEPWFAGVVWGRSQLLSSPA